MEEFPAYSVQISEGVAQSNMTLNKVSIVPAAFHFLQSTNKWNYFGTNDSLRLVWRGKSQPAKGDLVRNVISKTFSDFK